MARAGGGTLLGVRAAGGPLLAELDEGTLSSSG